jgi:S-DNA-T family DNA segregation ATPase FtsK/SpoIIIE
MARRSARSSRQFKVKLKRSTVFTISAILLFGISLLVWLSFLKKGLLLISVNNFLLANFGIISTFFLPFPIIASGLMLTKLKTSLRDPKVFLGSLVCLTAITGLSRGGKLGGLIWDQLSGILSALIAFIFLTLGLAIGIIIMLDIPLEEIAGAFSSFFSKLKLPSKKSDVIVEKGMRISGMTSSQAPLPSKPSEIKTTGLTDKSPQANSSKPNATFAPPSIQNASDSPWHFPPLSILSESLSGKADRGDIKANAAIIEKTLDAFGIVAKVTEINLGPAVTQYGLEVAIGTKLSKINSLSNDLALALAAPTGQIRIEAPIPGRSLVGIELPNHSPEFVSLRRMLDSDSLKNHKSKLAVALGLDVSGKPVVADIAKMPHVLIAGSTGSGKSVCINAFIATLLFRASPTDVKLILVDPKRVELTGYNGIPHLLTQVIVEPEKVISALKWGMSEMDRRYKLFAEVGVRNIDAYNDLSGFQALPYIVIFIDELADIMLFAPVEVEDAITRLAQMARATGIHLVLATQRPSVDVITGLIKANIPTRISFAVSSMIDSRVIVDGPGAEKLLGKGDMLFVPPDQAKPSRIQGAYVSDKEIHALIEHLKKQGIAPQYTDEVTSMPFQSRSGRSGRQGTFATDGPAGPRDPLFADALRTIVQHNAASASFLQRKLSIGYARAARILDELHQSGAIGPTKGANPRDILISDVEGFLASSEG